jgi:arylsulfatase A-like enzyme
MRTLAIAFAVLLGAQDRKSPNVLLIYTDDQTWRTLGCYGDERAWPWVRTPNIDRLAAEGVRFTTAYGAAWCTPSRASLLTGLLPHAIQGLEIPKVVGGGSYDPNVCRFWPSELRKAGYHTAMVGKWHIGPDHGHGREWDHSVVWNQADIQGDWYNNQPMSIDGAPKQKVPGYSTDNYTQYAVDYVKRDKGKPWLLWLCFNAPHLPNTFHPRHKEEYEGAEVAIPSDVFGPREGKPAYLKNYTVWKPGPPPDEAVPHYSDWSVKKLVPLPKLVRDYNKLVCALDEGIGRIRKALEETGQLENTIVIFTSDQGFAWGDKGFAWKVGPYESCMRMPMLVRWPGVAKAGGTCREPVAVYDLAPTIFAAAGAKLPWEMHGRDLRPLLEKPESRWDRPLLLEHFTKSFGPQTDKGVTGKDAFAGIPWWIFLRQGKYKYVRTLVEDEIEELYDLEADPGEYKNLALDPKFRTALAEHRDRFVTELKRTRAGLVDHLPRPRTAE